QRRLQDGGRGEAQGHPPVQHRADGERGLQRQPALVDLRLHPDGGGGRRQVRQGLLLVRQRVGILEPDGGPGAVRRRQAVRLSELLGHDVLFADDCAGDGVRKLAGELREGEVLLLENLRFHAEEEANDDAFSRELASLCEAYVDDAFGTVHRAHASTVGMVKYVPAKGAGFLVAAELKHLQPLLKGAPKPYLPILGGAKVSDKIKVIDQLLGRVDALLIGGAMAYTFLGARGVPVGASRVEKA